MNRHERRRRRTRDQLVTATQELLVESGYEALTVQHIADRADVARATFYVHFKDKEESVWAVLKERVAAVVEALADMPDLHDAAHRRAKWVRMFEFARAHRDLFDVVLRERGHIRLRMALSRMLVATLAHDVETGRVPQLGEVPVQGQAHFQAGGVLELMTWWLAEAPDLTAQQLADHLGPLVLPQAR